MTNLDNSWVSVYSSAYMHQVDIVSAVLKDNDITSVIINKQDSSYHFGEIELHVQADDVLAAKQIIQKNNL
jgi:hypothetical protein